MQTFLAVYRGKTISDARMVAVTSDWAMIGDIVDRLLSRPIDPEGDPALLAIDRGRTRALRLIRKELRDGQDE